MKNALIVLVSACLVTACAVSTEVGSTATGEEDVTKPSCFDVLDFGDGVNYDTAAGCHTHLSQCSVVGKVSTCTKGVRCGDVNGDCLVNIADIVALENDIMDNTKPSGTCTQFAADVNGDGKLDISDLTRLEQMVLGNAVGACPSS